MKVAVVKETGPAERRVALVPEAVAKLRSAGHEVLVEGVPETAHSCLTSCTRTLVPAIVSADQLAEADVRLDGRPPGRRPGRQDARQARRSSACSLRSPTRS